MTRSARTTALGLLLLTMVVTGVVTGVVTAALAHAHAVLLSTDPPADAQLSVGPTRVSATFNEQLQTTFAAMTVVGPDGNVWSAGEPQVQGAVISVGMRPLGPVGSYTVHYRVTSADGHVVSGTWSFRLTVPGAGTPGPSTHAPTTAGDRIPIWLFAGAAVLLVGAAAVWARRRS